MTSGPARPAAEPQRRTVAGPVGDVSYLVWAPAGTRVPFALAHPVNTQAAVWDRIAPLLTEDGRRPVVAVDYRGHGESAPAGPYDPRGYAADLLAVLDAEGIAAFHYAGGSIGGAVGVHLADLAPGRVRSASLLGAALRIGVGDDVFDDMAAGLRALGVDAWFAAHGGGIVGSRSVEGVAARLVELAGGRDTEQVVDIVDRTFRREDARALAARLAPHDLPPTQVVGGTEDPTCPPSMEREVAEILGADLVLLEGIGHLPMLESPTRTATLVLSLVSAVEA